MRFQEKIHLWPLVLQKAALVMFSSSLAHRGSNSLGANLREESMKPTSTRLSTIHSGRASNSWTAQFATFDLQGIIQTVAQVSPRFWGGGGVGTLG